jgi:flavin-dependent dehydrogenase
VKGIYVYSPDHKTKVLFEGEGYILNRRLMPKRQVKDAQGFGVEFKFGATAEKLIAEDGTSVGSWAATRTATPSR